MHRIAIFLIVISFAISCGNHKRDKKNLIESEIQQRADYHYESKEYLLAKLCYDTLINLNNRKADYYYRRAYSKYMLLTDDNGALLDFYKSIEFGYENKKAAYLGIGTIFRIYGKYDLAIKYYNRALNEDSGYERAKEEKDEVLRLLKKQK